MVFTCFLTLPKATVAKPRNGTSSKLLVLDKIVILSRLSTLYFVYTFALLRVSTKLYLLTT